MRIQRTRILITLAAVALTASACSDSSTVSGGTTPEAADLVLAHFNSPSS